MPPPRCRAPVSPAAGAPRYAATKAGHRRRVASRRRHPKLLPKLLPKVLPKLRPVAHAHCPPPRSVRAMSPSRPLQLPPLATQAPRPPPPAARPTPAVSSPLALPPLALPPLQPRTIASPRRWALAVVARTSPAPAPARRRVATAPSPAPANAVAVASERHRQPEIERPPAPRHRPQYTGRHIVTQRHPAERHIIAGIEDVLDIDARAEPAPAIRGPQVE